MRRILQEAFASYASLRFVVMPSSTEQPRGNPCDLCNLWIISGRARRLDLRLRADPSISGCLQDSSPWLALLASVRNDGREADVVSVPPLEMPNEQNSLTAS
jgi:hypothetical protein